MNKLSTLRGRAAVLIGATALLAAASLPVIGQAQNASPAANEAEQQLLAEGEKIYTNVCIACHQPDGKGIPGIYLPLAGNPLLTQEDPSYFISVVLKGRGGMPTFARTYNDEQMAAITTYVRQNWDNDAPAVSPEQVAEVRAKVITTPVPQPTPESQIPQGIDQGTPEASPAG